MTRENATIWDQLAEQFDDRMVGRMEIDGRSISYLNVQAVEGRLDKVLTPLGWNVEFDILANTLADGGSIVIECALTIYDGDRNGLIKVDVGEASATDGEAYKAAYSDSLKRAARRFGVGRYLAFV